MKKVWDKIVAFHRTLHQSPRVIKILLSVITVVMAAVACLLFFAVTAVPAEAIVLRLMALADNEEHLIASANAANYLYYAAMLSTNAAYAMLVTCVAVWTGPGKPKAEGGRCEKPLAEGAA